MDVIAAKRCLRQEIKERLRALTGEEYQKADWEIGGWLSGLGTWRETDVVLYYAGTGQEVNTSTIVAHTLEEGKRVGVPLYIAPGVAEVQQVEGMESLIPGPYRILGSKWGCPPIDLEEIYLAVVPGLLFAANGFRLGYGGGYYDRYLPRVNDLKLALCRGRCLSSQLPTKPHDMPMDGVLIEHSTWIPFHSAKI